MYLLVPRPINFTDLTIFLPFLSAFCQHLPSLENQLWEVKLAPPRLGLDDNINFLGNIKKGFERTVFWNKLNRSEITIQLKATI